MVAPDNPTQILFESMAFQTPTQQVPPVSDYTFALGGLVLVAGEDTAFTLDAYVERDRNVTHKEASVGIAASGADPDGTMFTIEIGPIPGGTSEDHHSAASFRSPTSTCRSTSGFHQCRRRVRRY